MAKKATFGSTKRFGPRYGRRNRDKVGFLEKSSRSLHKCPFCHYEKAGRLSAGIWQCTKCDSKFTGKAYTIGIEKKRTHIQKQKKVKIVEEEDDFDYTEEEPEETVSEEAPAEDVNTDIPEELRSAAEPAEEAKI